jgi:hypothetical protein
MIQTSMLQYQRLNHMKPVSLSPNLSITTCFSNCPIQSGVVLSESFLAHSSVKGNQNLDSAEAGAALGVALMGCWQYFEII